VSGGVGAHSDWARGAVLMSAWSVIVTMGTTTELDLAWRLFVSGLEPLLRRPAKRLTSVLMSEQGDELGFGASGVGRSLTGSAEDCCSSWPLTSL
jgi:hypothetical protein